MIHKNKFNHTTIYYKKPRFALKLGYIQENVRYEIYSRHRTI